MNNQGHDFSNLSEITIEEMMRLWPETVTVLHGLNLACPGCAIAPFCTVSEAAALYGLDLQDFLDRLLRVIQED